MKVCCEGWKSTSKNTNAQHVAGRLVFRKLTGRRPTLPHTRACSTIGAERLNFRVRDGNGWIPLATVTQNWFCSLAQSLRLRCASYFKEPALLGHSSLT